MAKSLPYKEIGERIAEARRRRGRSAKARFTQQQLADEIGVHVGTVTAWENGKQRPEGENLVRLAAALHVEPSALTNQLAPETARQAVNRVIRETRPSYGSGGVGNGEVERLIREIQALDLEEWQKTYRIAEVASIYRAKERDKSAAAAVIEAEAAKIRAEAALERARADTTAEQGALARGRIATPPADVQAALDAVAQAQRDAAAGAEGVKPA